MGKQIQALKHLLSKGKYSAVQISNALYIGDPRSVIRYARKIGINILDEWRDNKLNNGRHKIYWIDTKQ